MFRLGIGGVGPTEVRLVLVALNTLLALGVPLGGAVLGIDLTVLDAIGLAIAAVMLGGLLVRAKANLRVLAAREPVVRPAR